MIIAESSDFQPNMRQEVAKEDFAVYFSYGLKISHFDILIYSTCVNIRVDSQ